MSTKKATKRALLTSILAICLCLVMLIGSTFAWFTDTASTGVNQIVSGNLDVDIQDKEGNSLDKQTLKWVKADGTEITDQEKILWEPGCTYQLKPFKIVNKGNLALKYKIEITGIQGDAELLKVIDWKINDNDINLTEKHLAAKGNTGSESELLTITGHMHEDANNDYMNLSIDGIAITVYATQDTVENDSFSNKYDENATYPMALVGKIENVAMEPVKDGENVTGYTYVNTGATVKATVPADAVSAAPTISVVPAATNAAAAEKIAAEGKDAVAYDITISNVNENNTALITIDLFVGKSLEGVVVYHNGTAMGADQVTYNADTGFVTIQTTSFSNYAIAFDAPAAMANGVAYSTLQDALNAGGNVVLGKDVTVSEQLVIDKATTLNLNGKTIKSDWAMATEAAGEARYALLTRAAVTISNGVLQAGKARALGAYADLTLTNVTVSHGDMKDNACVAFCANDGKCTVTGSTITGNYAFANFANNATITITDSKLEGKSCGLYHNGSYHGLTLNVTGTTIIGGSEGMDATGVYISGSTATKTEGGYQNAVFTNCTIKGNAAVEVKYTDLTLNNCTAIATASGEPSYVQNNNGATTNGFAVVSTDNAKDNATPKPEGTITINGGNYTGLIGLSSLESVKATFPDFNDTTYKITGIS